MHVAKKQRKLRKFRFCNKPGSFDSSRNHASTQKVHHVPPKVPSGNNGTCDDLRDSNKEEQISWGMMNMLMDEEIKRRQSNHNCRLLLTRF